MGEGWPDETTEAARAALLGLGARSEDLLEGAEVFASAFFADSVSGVKKELWTPTVLGTFGGVPYAPWLLGLMKLARRFSHSVWHLKSGSRIVTFER